MREVIYSNKFKKELKLSVKRGKNIENVKEIIYLLANDIPLGTKYRPHILSGKNFKNCWECHIEADLLLVYEYDKFGMCILIHRLGTHADLFA